jgi:hypothetical protein
MNHEEAFRRLPDLLHDRDDAAVLEHLRDCADCQRQLFLLGRVDRALRDSAPVHHRHRTPFVLAGAAAAVAAAVLLAVVLPSSSHAHPMMLRTASGRIVAEATMTRADERNDLLALTAHGLPAARGHMFVLWASDRRSTMQVGRFMSGPTGGARVRFNLPASHHWTRLWVTQAGTMVASTV